jgi:hypothetical protein
MFDVFKFSTGCFVLQAELVICEFSNVISQVIDDVIVSVERGGITL